MAEGSVMRGVAEFYENDLNECLESRTESLSTFVPRLFLTFPLRFRELGPPDLCHLIKINSKSTAKKVSSYHFVLGEDVSSSATPAAYLNSLTYLLVKPRFRLHIRTNHRLGLESRNGRFRRARIAPSMHFHAWM
jgi:hypothetical protein